MYRLCRYTHRIEQSYEYLPRDSFSTHLHENNARRVECHLSNIETIIRSLRHSWDMNVMANKRGILVVDSLPRIIWSLPQLSGVLLGCTVEDLLEIDKLNGEGCFESFDAWK